MRWLTLLFVALIALLQYSLWLGKGSWLNVWEVNKQLDKQEADNKVREARNAALEAEVADLKQGYDAIEERARSELGMVKDGEVFFQVLPAGTSFTVASQPATSTPTSRKLESKAASSPAAPAAPATKHKP